MVEKPWGILLDFEDANQIIEKYPVGMPFIGSEREKDDMVDQLILDYQRKGLQLKQVHVIPLAWAETGL